MSGWYPAYHKKPHRRLPPPCPSPRILFSLRLIMINGDKTDRNVSGNEQERYKVARWLDLFAAKTHPQKVSWLSKSRKRPCSNSARLPLRHRRISTFGPCAFSADLVPCTINKKTDLKDFRIWRGLACAVHYLCSVTQSCETASSNGEKEIGGEGSKYFWVHEKVYGFKFTVRVKVEVLGKVSVNLKHYARYMLYILGWNINNQHFVMHHCQ